MQIRTWHYHGTFIVGHDGTQYVLTCLDDHSQHSFDTEDEAREWAKEYRPKIHERN